jgi:simple sugar transport system ATP-binding protein
MMLTVQHLGKSYGGLRALDDVSFDIKTGEAVGIMGDNGAGKSTLLGCLAGVIRPDCGTITLDGTPAPLGQPAAIRAMGVETVYQTLALCPHQTVVANLFLGRELINRWGLIDWATMRAQAQAQLEAMALSVPLDVEVGQLSGGQQQAVAIARALLAQPRLIIFDEPTAALGVRETDTVLEFIKDMHARGIAILMVSHRPGDLAATTSRVLTMLRGRIA